jgi:hypothetical protein
MTLRAMLADDTLGGSCLDFPCGEVGRGLDPLLLTDGVAILVEDTLRVCVFVQ